MTEMDLTYSELLELHRQRLVGRSPADTPADVETQVFRNQRSTLNGYLAFIGKSVNNRVGAEFLDQFEARSRGYLDTWRDNPKSRSDRQSHLRAWHRTVLEAQPQATPAEPSSFHLELRRRVAAHELPAKALARGNGVSTSALQRWLAGAYPNARSLPSLRRLENALGLRRGHLEDLIPNSGQPAQETAPRPITYRKRLGGHPYYLPVAGLNDRFREEWLAFFEYKTASYTPLARTTLWRLLPKDETTLPDNPLTQRHGLACASAEMALSRIRAYLGFLSLPTRAELSRTGLGLNRDDIQTLAMLAVPEYVNRYLEFIKEGSDGLAHAGHKGFAALIANLTRPRTGYLWQQATFVSRLPAALGTGRDWQRMCEETHKLANHWKRIATDASRDPAEPLRPLLELKQPLRPLFLAIKRLDELAAEAAPGSRAQAEHKRNALMLMLLISNPLRSRTLSLIRWRPDNSGNLYRHADGTWHVRLLGRNFKNCRGSLLTDYDARLDLDGLSERIDEYLTEYRPALVRKNRSSDWLFPNGKTAGKHPSLNRVIEKVTRRHIPEVLSFGPHAIRHLVATNYLANAPDDFRGVSKLLHDTLETVLAHYDHETSDRVFSTHNQHLSELAEMLRR